ncbi:RIP metalloprotease RseP [Frankineae bacterium MT45]|nr:RIP metalloprotease RseP [Frankineae bacterium MT45]
MLYALGVLIFALGLLGSIALHEVGHMVPAKKFGVKVTQYMVGFGPTLWSRKRGDTEYGVKAIPLGGYIRMIGMVPPRADGKVSRWPKRMATAVEDFRATSRSEVTPEDEDRQFYRLTPGKKIIVMLGGPTMNFVIYLVLTLLLAVSLGQKHQDATTTVGSVSQCVVKATDPSANSTTCPANAPAAPAYGVLKPGDRITAINGVAVRSWDDEVAAIERSANETVSMTITRDGASRTVSITPVENVKYANADGTKTKVAGFIGVAPTIHSYYAATPIRQVPGQVVSQIAQGVSVIGQYPSRVASVWDTVFEGKARDPEGAVGVVGIGRIGGEVAASHQFDVQDKIYILISLLASINLLLFFFNLIPLLPLDGGHVAGALVEAAKRGRARLQDRALARARARAAADPNSPLLVDEAPAPRKPIYVDTAAMLPFVYAVASVLIVVTLLIMYADIVKPVTIG